MASPWEGGSRPAKSSPATELAADLFRRGDDCAARLVSTGIITLFDDFAKAEAERRTHPSEVVRALTIITAAIVGDTVVRNAKQGHEQTALDGVIDIWSKIVSSASKAEF